MTHGDESLFVATGNVVGMFWVVVTAFVFRTTVRVRALAVGLAALAAMLPHLAPAAWMEEWPATWPRAAFLLGFAPPLAVAALVLLVDWRRARAAPSP